MYTVQVLHLVLLNSVISFRNEFVLLVFNAELAVLCSLLSFHSCFLEGLKDKSCCAYYDYSFQTW